MMYTTFLTSHSLLCSNVVRSENLYKNLLHAVHPSSVVNLQPFHSFHRVNNSYFVAALCMWNLDRCNNSSIQIFCDRQYILSYSDNAAHTQTAMMV